MGLSVPYQSFQLEILSHFFSQAIFLIFWPNERCVTGALFRFGPRFQFICPLTELSLSEKFRRPLREKEMQDQPSCQSSAEIPTVVYVNPALFMPKNSIRNRRMISIENTIAAHKKRFWYFWDQISLFFPGTHRWRCFYISTKTWWVLATCPLLHVKGFT